MSEAIDAINLNETCSCGSRFVLLCRWMTDAIRLHEQWLDRHASCRVAALTPRLGAEPDEPQPQPAKET